MSANFNDFYAALFDRRISLCTGKAILDKLPLANK